MKLFVRVVSVCVELGSKDEIQRIFLKNFQLAPFTDRLRKMGLKERDYEEWPGFIASELEKFENTLLAIKTY